MKNLIRENKKLIFAFTLCIILSSITSFAFFNINSNRDIDTMSFSQAKRQKQFHLDVRHGIGVFEIKPFTFKDIGSNSFKVYFKNEGRNDVTISFLRLDKDGKSYSISRDTVVVGESKEIVFKNPSDNNTEQYSLSIVDTTEPLPVVIGEFYIN